MKPAFKVLLVLMAVVFAELGHATTGIGSVAYLWAGALVLLVLLILVFMTFKFMKRLRQDCNKHDNPNEK